MHRGLEQVRAAGPLAFTQPGAHLQVRASSSCAVLRKHVMNSCVRLNAYDPLHIHIGVIVFKTDTVLFTGVFYEI